MKAYCRWLCACRLTVGQFRQ